MDTKDSPDYSGTDLEKAPSFLQESTDAASPAPTPTPAPAPAPASHPPPPDGGLQAWLQVLGAFLLFFNSWGVINTFGLFQSYYEEVLLTDKSPSAISWIGSFQGFLLLVVGIVVGPIFDKGYLKLPLAFGTILIVFGLMMTSLSTQYYQVFLAHGILVGCGAAFVFLPGVAIVATYFSTKRALATGITAAGGSIGSVIFPIMFRNLLGPLGFGWTTRIIAFVVLGTLVLSIALMKARLPPPAKHRAFIDATAFQEPPFVIYCFALLLGFIGLYFPFFYLPTFFTVKLHDSGDMSFYIIAVINAASLFGRIIPGMIAVRIGPINTIIPCAAAAVVMAFAWLAIRNVAGTIVFAVLYGFASAALVSLPLTITAQLSPNLALVGTRLGMAFCFAGLGLLIGNPIAGALLDLERGIFWKAQVFSASTTAAATVLFVVLRFVAGRYKEGWKM